MNFYIGKFKFDYIGCFSDNTTLRDLTSVHLISNEQTIDKCIDSCKKRGYLYAGLQNG